MDSTLPRHDACSLMPQVRRRITAHWSTWKRRALRRRSSGHASLRPSLIPWLAFSATHSQETPPQASTRIDSTPLRRARSTFRALSV